MEANRTHWVVQFTAGDRPRVSSPAVVVGNGLQWHHVAVTATAAQLTFWMDGVALGTACHRVLSTMVILSAIAAGIGSVSWGTVVYTGELEVVHVGGRNVRPVAELRRHLVS